MINHIYRFFKDLWYEASYSNSQQNDSLDEENNLERIYIYQQFFFIELIEYCAEIKNKYQTKITKEDILFCKQKSLELTKNYLTLNPEILIDSKLNYNNTQRKYMIKTDHYITKEFELEFEKIVSFETLQQINTDSYKNITPKILLKKNYKKFKKTIKEYILERIAISTNGNKYFIYFLENILKPLYEQFLFIKEKLYDSIYIYFLYRFNILKYYIIKEQLKKEKEEDIYFEENIENNPTIVDLKYYRQKATTYYYFIYALKFLYWFPNIKKFFSIFKVKKNYFDYPGNEEFLKTTNYTSWWYRKRKEPYGEWSLKKNIISHQEIIEQLKKEHTTIDYMPTPEEVEKHFKRLNDQENFSNKILGRYLEYCSKRAEYNEETTTEILDKAKLFAHYKIMERLVTTIFLFFVFIYLFIKYFIIQLIFIEFLGEPILRKFGQMSLEFINFLPFPNLNWMFSEHVTDLWDVIINFNLNFIFDIPETLIDGIYDPGILIKELTLNFEIIHNWILKHIFGPIYVQYNTFHILTFFDDINYFISMLELDSFIYYFKFLFLYYLLIKFIIIYDITLIKLYHLFKYFNRKIEKITVIYNNNFEFFTLITIQNIGKYIVTFLYPNWRDALRSYNPQKNIYPNSEILSEKIIKYLSDFEFTVQTFSLLFNKRLLKNLKLRFLIILNKIIDFCFYISYIFNIIWITLFIYQIFIKIFVPLYLFSFIIQMYNHLDSKDFFIYYPSNLIKFNTQYKLDFFIYLYISIMHFNVFQIFNFKFSFIQLKQLFYFTNFYIFLVHIPNVNFCFLTFFLLKKYFYPSFEIVTVFFCKTFASFKNYQRLYLISNFLIKAFIFFNISYLIILLIFKLITMYYNTLYFIYNGIKIILTFIIIILDMMCFLMFLKIKDEIYIYYEMIFQEKLLYIKSKKKYPEMITQNKKKYIIIYSFISFLFLIHSWFIFTHSIYLLEDLLDNIFNKIPMVYTILEIDNDLRYNLGYNDEDIEDEDEDEDEAYEYER